MAKMGTSPETHATQDALAMSEPPTSLRRATDGAPWSQSALGRRANILSRAAELFDANGLHNTKMEAVAEAAGISKATLYYYFPSKGELLYEMHERFIGDLIAGQRRRLATSMSPTDSLNGTFRDILDVIHDRRGHIRVFFENYRELPEDRREEIRGKRAEFLELVEEVVRRGVANGEFQVEDTRIATLGILGMCNWSYIWYQRDGDLPPHAIADMFWRQAVRGLRTT
jgi:AcrR family transcriptional regulator